MFINLNVENFISKIKPWLPLDEFVFRKRSPIFVNLGINLLRAEK